MTDAPHILIVDDEPEVLHYLQLALEAAGYRVTAIGSGKQALEFIQQETPDLFILDLNMPEPDGFEQLKAARTKHPYLRILVISGYLQGALLEAARIFGAVATLEKPVAAHVLVAKVREILGQ